MSFLRMDELNLAGKRVMIREDFNVPLETGRVTSDARLRAGLPTIRMALDSGAAVILLSHLGRPVEGQYEDKFSLLPVAEHLSGLKPWRAPWQPYVMSLLWTRLELRTAHRPLRKVLSVSHPALALGHC
jgi:3-phosphoglycerate kinase